jgi:ribose/xylose/arabinose/galactoside ABC-type transport system permease subunit/ABC-type sugar transport system substrate-binding protein
VVVLLAGLLAVFASSHSDPVSGARINNFANAHTLLQILTDANPIAVMAVGMTAVIIAGGIDLSVGAIYALATIAMAVTLRSMGGASGAASVTLGFGIAASVGLLCGLANGLLTVALDVHPFIVTLGTMWALRGMAFVASGGESILVPASLTSAVKSSLALGAGLAPIPALVMIVVAAVGAVYLTRTIPGRHIFAVGGNAEAARYAGLRVSRIRVGVFALSGLCAGVAAFVSAAYYGSASSADATGYELYVIAAAVVGGASLAGGRGNAINAMLGAILIVLMRQAIRTLHWDQNYEWIIIGVALIGAVVLDRVSGRVLARRLVTVLVAALVLPTLNACSRGEKAEKGNKAEAASGFRIAMIAKSSTNPLFLSARAGADKAADSLSKVYGRAITVDWRTPPQEDGQVQAQRIAQAVNDGVDAVLVSASDASKLTGAIDDAVARGVPVMTFDSDVPRSKRFSFYGPDDVDIGRQVMRELAAQMGERGKVAILAGNQNAPNLQLRAHGAREEAARHPGIRVVGVFNHIETPQDAAAEVMRVQGANPDVTGWAALGGWPLLTRTLLTDLDASKVKMVAVDALPAELVYVERGLAPVLLAQPTFQWGYTSVVTIVDHVISKKTVPEHVVMPLIRVTKENVGEWRKQLKAWGFDSTE